MSDPNPWPEIHRHATEQLSAGFSARVLARAAQVRHTRRQFTTAAVTLALCISATAGVWGWQVHREHEENLAQWQEFNAITIAMEQL